MYRVSARNAENDGPKWYHKAAYYIWPVVAPILRAVWLLFFPVWYLLYPAAICIVGALSFVLLGSAEDLLEERVLPRCEVALFPPLRIKGVRPYCSWWINTTYDYKRL